MQFATVLTGFLVVDTFFFGAHAVLEHCSTDLDATMSDCSAENENRFCLFHLIVR